MEVIRIRHCPKIALTCIPGRAKPQRKGAEGWRIIHKIKATLRSRNEVPHGVLLNYETDLQAPCRKSDIVTNPVPPWQGLLNLFRLLSTLPHFILYLNLKLVTQSHKPGIQEDAVYSSSSCVIEWVPGRHENKLRPTLQQSSLHLQVISFKSTLRSTLGSQDPKSVPLPSACISEISPPHTRTFFFLSFLPLQLICWTGREP